jgi:hypothetical protein
MAWQGHRGGPKRYYTRTVRTPVGRKRIYFGTGPLAEIAAHQDAMARLTLEIGRRERQDEQPPGRVEDQTKEGLTVALEITAAAFR